MKQSNIGIGDIGLYIPTPRMDMTTLMRHRAETHPELEAILNRAIDKTGQASFRFPEPWEDTSSLAGNAAAVALDRIPENERGKIRYIAVGTETAVDHSKPVASYVQGMLLNAGYPLGHAMTTFELKHACAGGTAALLSTAAMLSFSGDPDERALAICSDIARYDAPSTAEITQGAGAAALVVEKNPRLLEMELEYVGMYASDVDDFFRPLDSTTAKVKGRYSMECYQEGLNEAFVDYCNRSGGTTCTVVDETDYIALHVPFAKMPEVAVRKLLKDTCLKDADAVEEFLERTHFLEAMYLSRGFGNLYTGSLYAYLVALLHQEYRRIGSDIVGKRILIASYGSGNTMFVFSTTVAPRAPEVIETWDIAGLESQSRSASFSEYLNWLARPKDLSAWRNLLEGATPDSGLFYLKDFGDTGLRIYDRA